MLSTFRVKILRLERVNNPQTGEISNIEGPILIYQLLFGQIVLTVYLLTTVLWNYKLKWSKSPICHLQDRISSIQLPFSQQIVPSKVDKSCPTDLYESYFVKLFYADNSENKIRSHEEVLQTKIFLLSVNWSKCNTFCSEKYYFLETHNNLKTH